MLTEYQQRLINGYIPSPRDETLDPMEYYYIPDNGSEKCFKVYITDIYSTKDGTLYGCRYSSNGNRVHNWLPYDGIPKRDLYDNKQDCRDRTHSMQDDWEYLRELQQKEAEQ